MGADIRLGRIAGVEVAASWSLLVILGLITWNLGAGIFPTGSSPAMPTGDLSLHPRAAFTPQVVDRVTSLTIASGRGHLRRSPVTLPLGVGPPMAT